jgi:hypothetical protein
VQEIEVGGHHADDGRLHVRERDLPAHDGGIRGEEPPPRRLGQHRSGRRPRLVVGRRERATEKRLHAQDLEVLRLHHRAVQSLRVARAGEVEGPAAQEQRDLLEGLALRAPVLAVEDRDVALARDEREPLGLRERQGPEHHRVHDAEDRGVRADAERQRQERDGREARALGQPAQREPHVLEQCIHTVLLRAYSQRSATIGSTRVARRAGI